MTVFKATQAVNLNATGFGTVFSIFVGNPVFEVHTGAELEVRNSLSTIEIDLHSAAGHPFIYVSNTPVGGNIGSIQVNEPVGSIAYKLSAMSVPITSLALDVNSGHYAAALNLIFGGNDTITGSAFGDFLGGFGGNDRITGGTGSDRMAGGPGNDTFVFRAGFGTDVITDFAVGTTAAGPHDTIELHSISHLANFAQVKANASIVNNHVVIDDHVGDTITLNSVHTKAQLHNFDFHFMT